MDTLSSSNRVVFGGLCVPTRYGGCGKPVQTREVSPRGEPRRYDGKTSHEARLDPTAEKPSASVKEGRAGPPLRAPGLGTSLHGAQAVTQRIRAHRRHPGHPVLSLATPLTPTGPHRRRPQTITPARQQTQQVAREGTGLCCSHRGCPRNPPRLLGRLRGPPAPGPALSAACLQRQRWFQGPRTHPHLSPSGVKALMDSEGAPPREEGEARDEALGPQVVGYGHPLGPSCCWGPEDTALQGGQGQGLWSDNVLR